MKHILCFFLMMATALYSAETKKQEAQEEAREKQHHKTPAVQIERVPRIEYAGVKSAMIAWSTNEPSSTKVFYGTDKNNLSKTAEAKWGGKTHRVDIKGLQPNTTYYFRVDSGQAKGTGTNAESGIYSFHTAVNAAQATHEQPATRVQ